MAPRQRLIGHLSDRFRAARDEALKAMIVAERRATSGPLTILDLGGRADYCRRLGFDFLDAHDLHVVCVDHIEAELYASSSNDQHARLKARVGDATNMVGVADNSYHLVHSNSVVEHVGQFANMRAFADEARRLATGLLHPDAILLVPDRPALAKTADVPLDAAVVAPEAAAPPWPWLGRAVPRHRSCHA